MKTGFLFADVGLYLLNVLIFSDRFLIILNEKDISLAIADKDGYSTVNQLSSDRIWRGGFFL